MPTVALTDRFCSTVKAGSTRIDYFDEKTHGLALRVAPSGIRTFTVHFGPASRRLRLTLGRYPRLSLARARSLALEALAQAHKGEDPRYSGPVTLADVATAYLEQHVRPSLRSAPAIERRLRKNTLPVIGKVPLTDLHRRDINAVLSPILARGKRVEAARVFEDIRALLRWAVSRGDLDNSPAEGMRKPAEPTPRERVLSPAEIATLWNGLAEALPRSPACQRIVELCLLTAQRVGEVSGIRRDELDLSARIWTIPGARTKNKHVHVVPLSDLAFDIIADVLTDKGGTQFLFPNDEGEGPLASHAVAKTIRLAQERFGIGQWTAHDLRRTVITQMAELGVTPIVLGHVINHRSVTKAGVTLSVYSHYDYAKEKLQALELWADRLMGIIQGAGKVVPLRA